MRAPKFFMLIALVGAPAVQAAPASPDYASLPGLVLSQNLDLRSAGSELDIARARVDLAEARTSPNFNFIGYYDNKSASAVEGQLPDRKFIPQAQQNGIKAADFYLTGQNSLFNRAILHVPLYTGGHNEALIGEARARVGESAAVLERQRQTVVYAAKVQYLLALLYRDRIEVGRQVLITARETLRIARTRLSAGVGNRYEVEEATTAVAGAQDLVTQAESGAQASRAELSALVHQPPTTPWEFPEDLTSPRLLAAEPEPSQDLPSLAALALRQRPELEEWRYRLLANREQGRQANAGLLPQLATELQYDLLGNPASMRGGFVALATLLLPIYDGGLAAAQFHELDQRRLQLTLRDIDAARKILKDLVRAELDLEEASLRVKSATLAERQAGEAERIAAKRFEVGAGSSLELVNAQTVHANARFGLDEAWQRLLAARAGLTYALGFPLR